MRIREVSHKAEQLIDTGERAREQLAFFGHAVEEAGLVLARANVELQHALQKGEEGESIGDMDGALARVYTAQRLLDAAERGYREAITKLEQINQDKQETLHTLERYTDHEIANLTKWEALQEKQFGSNVNTFIADLVSRMNTGEAAKDRLLQSMGQSARGRRFSAAGVAGTAGLSWASSSHTGEVSPVEPRMRRPSEEVQLDYILKSYDIFNNPRLTRSEKLQALREERMHMLVGMSALSGDSEQQPVRKRGVDKDTFNRVSNRREVYSTLLDEEGVLAHSDESKLDFGSEVTVKLASFLKIHSFDASPYKGVACRGQGSLPLKELISRAAKSPSARRKLTDRYNFRGMVETGGMRGYVTGNPRIPDKLVYTQGDNKKGWEQTCGIAQAANVLRYFSIDTNEEELCELFDKHGYCVSKLFNKSLSGGTTAGAIAAGMSKAGAPAHYSHNLKPEDLASLVESNRGVIVGVNAGFLWGEYEPGGDSIGSGAANHAVSISATVRHHKTGDLIGFVINDTGRDSPSDKERVISLLDFYGAYDVPGNAAIVTDHEMPQGGQS